MKPEDVWDVKKQSIESSNIVLDGTHLDAPTWHYIVGWFLFGAIRYVLSLAIMLMVVLFGGSEINQSLIAAVLDGPVLLLSIYISHGMVFSRTNMRKVFPWFILVGGGGAASLNETEFIEMVSDAGMNVDAFAAIFTVGFGFFLFFTYKYFTNLEPTRWVAKIKKEE